MSTTYVNNLSCNTNCLVWYLSLNVEKLCWNVLSFRNCLKACQTTIPLMFAVEAHNFAKNCTKQRLWKHKFKNCATTWRLVTIATWLILSNPYPQCSRFSRLTNFGHAKPSTSFSALIWGYVCMFMGITGTYVCMYVCMYVCTYVRTYVCMYVCMCVCMYVCDSKIACLCQSIEINNNKYVCMYVCGLNARWS